ncbi:helix-turn-helix domain-containing protein [uncultured Enterovirga sp.]|uniref:helix-turn-helix domain-containing protein n=1 Tax=uncultured Enterovirga sp. TaxID=2026352 RepID=UPI0035CB14CD
MSPSSARTPCSPARIAAPNRNYVGMIEREENAPTVDTLEKLAEVLQVEPTSLLQR